MSTISLTVILFRLHSPSLYVTSDTAAAVKMYNVYHSQALLLQRKQVSLTQFLLDKSFLTVTYLTVTVLSLTRKSTLFKCF